MRITYVLPQPELGGGNKVIFQHAQLLAARGDEVTLLAQGPRPTWMPIAGRYIDASSQSATLPSQDLVIATFWTTLATARALQLGPLAHFCQGYEGSHRHYHQQLKEIEAAYAEPCSGLAVTPHLVDLLERLFDRQSRVVPPPLDPAFRSLPRWRPRRRPWVVVPGVFEAPVKGVATALAAVRRLRQGGVACRLLRISTVPLSESERALLVPDRYLCDIPPQQVAEELASCDLLLLPSQPEEGFGLPLLEAMVAKVPAVASRIPSTEFMAGEAVSLVPAGDADAFAAASRRLLLRPARWRQARRAGYRAAQKFDPDKVSEQLFAAVDWASRQSPQSATRPSRPTLPEAGR